MSIRILILFVTVVILAVTCNRPTAERLEEREGKAQNVILLIGDGMGLAQLSTVYHFGDSPRSFDRFRCIGLHRNTATDAKITDSAAGATAFSTGYKTYNGAIGVDEDTAARETILEWAARRGKSTGVIATSSITHATPASFYAHVAFRHQHEDIALDFIDADIDFAAGGGSQYFLHREDGQDLVRALRDKGVEVSTGQLSRQHEKGRKYTYLLAPDSLNSYRYGRGDFLPSATRTAIDHLSADKEGFFLMVEGSQIDWGGHANDSEYIITETADFDRAIKEALDFAEKDGNTLVVVTADHETGGYSLSAATVFGRRDYRAIQPTFSTGGHSASLIPVFAFGPGAEGFMGVYENDEIFGKMMASFKQ